MTTITIERALLEQVQEFLYRVTHWKGGNHEELTDLHDMKETIKAALVAPATAPEQMPLERDCICHQYLHLDAYSGGAAPEGLHGALWVVVEGVRKKYVLADQSSEPKDMPALATTPKQPRPFVPWSKEAEMLESWAAQPATAPAWHVAPTVPGLWLNSVFMKVEDVEQWHIDCQLHLECARWFGPIPPDGDKP